MYTESTSSYKGNGFYDFKEPIPLKKHTEHNNRLPKDVLEALENNNYEKALELLRRHEIKEGKGSPKRVFIKKIITRFIPFIHVLKKSGKKIQRTGSFTFVRPFVKFTFVRAGRIVAMTFKSAALPVKLAINGAKTLVNKMGELLSKTRDGKQTSEGKKEVLQHSRSLPLTSNKLYQMANRLTGKLQATFSNQLNSLKEGIQEIQATGQDIHKFLNKNLENFLEKQQWSKKILGNQAEAIAKTMSVANQVVAVMCAPVFFISEKIWIKMRNSFQRKRRFRQTFIKSKRWAIKNMKFVLAFLQNKGKRFHSLFLKFLKIVFFATIAGVKKIFSYLSRWSKKLALYLYKKIRKNILSICFPKKNY
jgi:hypothetical protein